jgi:dipeptidyl-peptidase-4
MNIFVILLSVLPGILAGDYNAKTLSVAEQDSILLVESQKVLTSTPINVESQEENDVCSRYRLESENAESIFRRSEMADWYVYDTMRHTRKHLGDGVLQGVADKRVREVVMSPNGRYVAFVKDNNLYIHKADYGTEVAVTKDENKAILNGVADWLYEEEFGVTTLCAWSPDSKQLAFIKLDETEVPTFSWTIYSDTQYPHLESLKYPKAGCANAKASVCIYDVATKGIREIQVESKELKVESGDYYPRMRWYNENTLFVLRVNRDQTKMEVLSCNTKTTVSYPWYREEGKDYFIDYSLFDEWQWLSDGRMIVLSEKEGWRRAYLYGNDGIRVRALTPEGMDVTAIYAVDEKAQVLYFQAAPKPSVRHVYAVKIESKKSKDESPVQLTEGDGLHSARFSKDCKWMIAGFQSFTTPNSYTLYKVESKKSRVERVRVLEDNKEVKEAWEANQLPEPEMVRINNLEGMLLMPVESRESKVESGKRPLVVMHYSGPATQRVLNRWRKRFEYALVEAGYAVLIVDPRGSDCKGRAWRNETYMNLGVKEAEDLIAAANWAAKRDDIDGERMAILGWSYGGYETLMSMSMKGHPFKCGVAIAPVTDWKLYDSAYTERYMRRPQVNPRGYEAASLIHRAAELTGDVLIIHGTGDDNVHVQQTMQYVQALVEADKQFEMQLYPDDNHFLRKGNNAKHMHERVLRFLEKELRF